MPLNCLVVAVLALAAGWKIRRALRYRKYNGLFVQEVPGALQVEESRLKAAIRTYIFIESYFYGVLPFLVALSSVGLFAPYVWPIGISFLLSWGIALVWWNQKFAVKKPVS